MYGEVVDGIDGRRFEEALSQLKEAHGAVADTDLTADDLRELVETFKQIYRESLGHEFPQNARTQLRAAVEAVFRSWQNPRAKVYRQLNDIPDTIGTAVNIVQMVFGNAGERSATGVAFSRDPATGEKTPHGEFLVDAQGEDVVAGSARRSRSRSSSRCCRARTLNSTAMEVLEHYRDVRTSSSRSTNALHPPDSLRKRTEPQRSDRGRHGARGLISREEAVMRIEPGALDHVLHPMIDRTRPSRSRRRSASPGAAVGAVVFDDLAAERGKHESVILVRFDTTPTTSASPQRGHPHRARRHGLPCGGRRGMGKPALPAALLSRSTSAGLCTISGVTVREASRSWTAQRPRDRQRNACSGLER
jgi:pyruvate,orthophosphate dikinase